MSDPSEMKHVLGLRCTICGAEYALGEVEYVCPKHGDSGNLDVVYDYDGLRQRVTPAQIGARRDPSIARYVDLLPVTSAASFAPLPVGGTPLYRADRLGRTLGMTRLYLKDDGRNPTASLKDRASAVGVARARELGHTLISGASTGNAAASLAGQTAAAGMEAIIFVPESAPPAKIAQLLVYGAKVLAVEGNYDAAYDLCLQATHIFGWYNRNTGYNPFLSEGKKSVLYEICEQYTGLSDGKRAISLNPADSDYTVDHWQAPDWIVVPVGDGCIIGGVGKGARDLWSLGWIDRPPHILGVQATGSSAIYNAWLGGTETIRPVAARTVADSIAVDRPRDPIKALRSVRDTGGAMVQVNDDAILSALGRLGRDAAVFAEPAAAATLAGLETALQQGIIGSDESVVLLITGNGLKDVAAARKAVGQPYRLAPTLPALKALVQREQW